MTPPEPERPFDFERDAPPQRRSAGDRPGDALDALDEERDERGRRIFDALREAERRAEPPPAPPRAPAPPPRRPPERAPGEPRREGDPAPERARHEERRPAAPPHPGGGVGGAGVRGTHPGMQPTNAPRPTPPDAGRPAAAPPERSAPAGGSSATGTPSPPPRSGPPATGNPASSPPREAAPPSPSARASSSPAPSPPTTERPGADRPGIDAETRPMPAPFPDQPRPPSAHAAAPSAPAPPRTPPPDATVPVTPSPVAIPREEGPPSEVPAETAVPRLARPPQVGPVKRTLRFGRIGIASVFKLSLAIYLAVLAVLIGASVALWTVLGASGVIGNIEGFFGELLGYEDFEFLGWRILQIVVLIGLVWVVVAATVTAGLAFLYNRMASVVGALELHVEEE